MLGNTGNVGVNLKKGLMGLGHNVVLCFNPHVVYDNEWVDYPLSYRNFWFHNGLDLNSFDIIHINAPDMMKFLFCWLQILKRHSSPKIVMHWHGSNLRYPFNFIFQPFFTNVCKHLGDFHLYSSIDLCFYLRNISDDCKMLFLCPVDTDVFKPMIPLKCRPFDKLVWGKGRVGKDSWIPHGDVPVLLNQYRTVETYPDLGVSPFMMSVSALEAGSCGCRVVHHPYLTRRWVLGNASVESQSRLLEGIYKHLLEDATRVGGVF